ncbi:MAG: hypothetical protein ACO3F3_02865 [Gemmataceae bacterium]
MSSASIQIACPECGKKLTVSQELLGKKVRCKGCSKVFVATPETPKASLKEEKKETTPSAGSKNQPTDEEEDSENSKNPYGLTETIIVARCPNCANKLLNENDIVCVYCGYNNRTRVIGRTKKTYDVTGKDKFVWLLPGIITGTIALSILIFNIIFLLKIDGWVEPGPNETDGPWYSFVAHVSIKLWLVILSLAAIWALGKIAVNRLIFNNKPPEEEIL